MKDTNEKSHTLSLSYHRIDEEDGRMKAIQDGKSAVEKEYTTLGSSISAEGGSLDIAKLADPNAVTGTTETVEPPPTTAPKKVRNYVLVFIAKFWCDKRYVCATVSLQYCQLFTVLQWWFVFSFLSSRPHDQV